MVSESLGRKLGAGAGIIFFVLIMVASGMLPSDPGPDEAAAKIVSAYGKADGALLGVFLNSIAAVALLWFASTLRETLALAEGGVARLSQVVLASAAAAATFGVGSGIIHGAVWSRLDQSGAVNGDVVATLYVLAGAMLSGFFIFAGIMALVTGIVTLRHGALPTWTGWFSLFVGLMMLVGAYDVTLSEGVGFLGLIGMMLFFIVVPTTLLLRVGRLAPTAGAPKVASATT